MTRAFRLTFSVRTAKPRLSALPMKRKLRPAGREPHQFRSRPHLPSFQVNASAGADIYKSDRLNMKLQVDGENLTNVLDVIDFGGLFSGNAIGPSRSYSLRLTTTF